MSGIVSGGPVPGGPGTPGLPPPCADLAVDGVALAPGTTVAVAVRIRNRLERTATFSVAVLGLEDDWASAPPRVGPIVSGAAADAIIRLRLPVGYPPATLMASVTVRALDGGPRDPAAGPAVADLPVIVGDNAALGAAIDPDEIRGRGRFNVILRNRGAAPMRVELDANAPGRDVRIGFSDATPVVEPGRELKVSARARGERHAFGPPRRLPFTVRAQGKGSPVVVDGAVVARPLIAQPLMKMVAVLAVIGLWAAVAVVAIGAIDRREQHTAASRAANSSPPLTSGRAPTGGSSSGSASSGGKGGSSGSTSGGTGGSNASGNSRGPGGKAGAGALGIGGEGTTRVGGRITAASAGGVKVTITPTSLVSAAAEGAKTSGSGGIETAAFVKGAPSPGNSLPLGKVYAGEAGASLDPQLTAAVDPAMSTTTTPDGSWAFSQVPVPGTFLVTFSKPGYASAKYVVTTSSSKGVTLDASLSPGNGSLSGAVSGPHGPLGGATVAITDGTAKLTTRTPSTGAGVGTWSAAGLTTPDTYLITVTDPSFGTQTQVVTLGAGGSRAGVDVTMSAADGDITGTVSSSAGPVGGVTVTASGGGTTVTATTSTVAPVGTYTLPNLPMPGTYTLSVSGAGWLAQTRRVTLPGPGKVNPFLTASTGDVGGTVTLGSADVRQSGVGLILSNRTDVFKTLTTDTGGFELQGIPPGNYLLTAEYFGFQSRSAQVTVRAGAAPAVTDFHLPANGTTSQDQGTIQGLVLDLFTSKPAVGVDVSVDGQPVLNAGHQLTTTGDGSYVVHGLPPGLHQVELVDANTNPKKGSVDLQATDVQVDVPLDGVGVAPTAEMDKLDNYSGNVVSEADGTPVAGATVTLLQASSDHAPVNGVKPATTRASGAFSLHGIPAGNYEISVTGPHHADGSDDFGSSTFPLTMAPDVDLQQQVVRLTLLPSFQVVTDQVNAAGSGYGPISGVCVTVTDNVTGTSQSKYTGQFRGDGDELFFGGLDDGVSYTARYARYTSGTCRPSPRPETATPTTFTAVADNTAVQQVFVAAKVPALTVPLTYTTVTASGTGSCPVETGLSLSDAPCTSPSTLPTVTLTGISGFDGAGNPVDVTLTAAYCAGQPPCPPNDAGTWLFAKADLDKLVGASATLSVGGDPNTFQSFTKTVQLGRTTSINVPVTLSPMPSSISGSGPAIPGLHAAVVPATVTVTGEGSNLVWSQPPESTGEALPGTYQVTYSAPDYEGPGGAPSVTQHLAIGLCDGVGCAVPQPLDDSALVHEPSLNVTPTGLPPAATATVSLYFDGDPIAGVAPQQIQAGGTATFAGLSPFKQSTAEGNGQAGYGFSVTSAGSFPFYSPDDPKNPGSDPFHTITESNAGDLNETPAMTAVPSITGSVTGTIGGTTSPVGGATVTAALQGGCPAAQQPADLAFAPNGVSTTFPATLTATTSTVDGSYTIVGTIGGATNTLLCPGGTYTVSVQAAGYQSTSTPVTAAQTGPTTQEFNIQATPIAQPITVTGPNGSQLPAALPVTVIAIPTSGSNFYFNTEAGTGVASCGGTPSPTVGTSFCAAPLEPVPYTYDIAAPGYEPLSLPLILYSPGSCPSGTCKPLTETLSPDQSTIGGTAALADGTAVPGLKLDLDVAGDNPPVVQATTTTVTAANATSSSPAGSFTFTGVPDGSYYITPDPSTGYSLPATPVIFQTQYPTALKEGVTVQATPVNLDVTADVGVLRDPNLANATVTLTPDSGGTVAADCAAKPPDASGNPASECTGSDPLLATGAATGPVSGQLSGSGGTWTTQIPSVTPDVYRLTISGPGVPSQAAIVVRVAPDTSGTDNLGFNVLEGEISGSVTWDGTLQANSPTITVNGTGNTTPTINCSTGSCTYSTYVPLGNSFTVSASLAGFTGLSTPSETATAADPSLRPAALALQVIDRTVDVTATSGGAGQFPLAGATLELANADPSVYDKTLTAGTDGSATFANVPPSLSPYTITVTFDGTTDTGSVTVNLAPAANPTVSAPVTLAAGKVSGAVSVPSGLAASSVTVYVCPSSAASSAATCDAKAALESATPSAGRYSALVPAGSYWIGQSAESGFTISTTENNTVTVGDGTTVTGPTVSYTANSNGNGNGNGP